MDDLLIVRSQVWLSRYPLVLVGNLLLVSEEGLVHNQHFVKSHVQGLQNRKRFTFERILMLFCDWLQITRQIYHFAHQTF